MGYTSAEANEVVGKKKRYEFNLTFYEEEGVPFVVATGWDPTKGTQPVHGDHGPYYDRRFATAYGIAWTAASFHKAG